MKKTLLFLVCVLATAGHALAQHTLTITAQNVTVHQGDAPPPYIGIVTGYNGSDTWTTATTGSGVATYSSSYTSSSAVGTYPITVNASAVTPAATYSVATAPGTVTVIPPDGTGAIINLTPPQQMPGGMINVVTQTLCPGVVGDGVTDDTAALNCLFQTNRTSGMGTYIRFPKQFFFPPGVYLVSGELTFNGCCETWLGSGPSQSIIRLAPNSSGYTVAGTNKPLIYFPGEGGNNGYSQYIENLGIDIAPGNPGVQAVQFVGNNFDGFKNDYIWSEDSTGLCGVCMTLAWPGATIMKNVATYGFQYGSQYGENEYSITIEGMTAENYGTYGIQSPGLSLQVRDYFSVGAGSCLHAGTGNFVLLSATCIGGASTYAVQDVGGTLYVRGLSETGFTNAVLNQAVVVPGPTVRENWTGTLSSAFGNPAPAGLFLPIQETPEANDPVSGGVMVAGLLGPDPNTWNASLATCSNSLWVIPVLHNYTAGVPVTGNDIDYTGVYAPTASGNISINVPDCVNHIIGNQFQLDPSSLRLEWAVAGTSSTPIIFELMSGSQNDLLHTGSRTVVIKENNINYSCANGAGTVFFESNQSNPINLCVGQSFYARQYDNESQGNAYGATGMTATAGAGTGTISFTGVNMAAGIPFPVVGQQYYFISNFNTPNQPGFQSTSAIVTAANSSAATLTFQDYYTIPALATTTIANGNFFELDFSKTNCQNSTMWVLGYKTEKSATNLTANHCQVEILGGFFYPIEPVTPNMAPINITDSNFFGTYMFFETTTSFGGGWPNFVNETRSGTLRSTPNTVNPVALPAGTSPGGSAFFNGYSSYSPTVAPPNIGQGHGKQQGKALIY
jgi:Pectate lyase superfamily protein/MBG domain (YGX type)